MTLSYTTNPSECQQTIEWCQVTIICFGEESMLEKNLGRLWLAYTELQVDVTCYN